MKQLLFLTMVVAQAMAAHGQANEFTVYPNGLVYSDTTMLQLRHIVDSLNLKFRHCDVYKKYYSGEQGIAHTIDLETRDAPAAFRDIQQGISFGDFIQKYRMAKVDSNLLVTRSQYTDRRLQVIDYYTIERPGANYAPDIDLCHAPPGKVEEDHYSIKGINNHWIFDFTKPGTKTLNTRLRAFYISRALAVAPIPDRYAKLIQYADCMIDTTTGIYNPNARQDGGYFYRMQDNTRPHAKMDAFKNYFQQETTDIFAKYRMAVPENFEWQVRDSLIKLYLHDSLSSTSRFKQLFSEAVEETLRYRGETTDFFEYCVAAYYSKSAALAMKRSRRVVGGCSMDDRPRQHAINIALLAAETANWEVFLRAHLDIMNDRFDRVSDGSWAWEARNTYIREIEELGIDVQDLMLGIAFYTSNAPANHYFGSIGRMGRAFAETKYRASLEQKLLTMIADNELDDLNRLRMRYLFLDYVYYLPRKEDRMACLQQLDEADKTLPACIASGIKTNRALYEQGNVRR